MEQDKLIALPLNEDKGTVDIMTVAKILSCQERTIKSYVEQGLFPKPIEIKEGKRYFIKNEILAVLGIDDLNEEMIKTSDGAKHIGISILQVREFVQVGFL